MSNKITTLGELQIGEVPYIVGTIASFASLNQFASSKIDICDIVEVRLDEIGENSQWLEGCKEIESSGMPIILTIRLKSEGGKWNKPDKLRLPLFLDAVNNLSCVDIELDSDLMEEVSELGRVQQKPVLISYHNFENTPTLGELKEIATRAAKYGALVKISTMAKTPEDLIALQKLMECDFSVPLCVIGMGAFGTRTRVSFPTMGSCLTYGYLDAPSAPGQLSARKLNEQLRLILPKYNEQFIIKKQILEYA